MCMHCNDNNNNNVPVQSASTSTSASSDDQAHFAKRLTKHTTKHTRSQNHINPSVTASLLWSSSATGNPPIHQSIGQELKYRRFREKKTKPSTDSAPRRRSPSQRSGRVHGSTGLPSKRPQHTFRRGRLVGRQHAELYGSGGEPLRGPPRHTALGGHGRRCARCAAHAKVPGWRHNDDTEQIGIRRAAAARVSAKCSGWGECESNAVHVQFLPE